MNKDKNALKSGLWYTVSNFLVKGIGLITTPIFTRLLTKSEFGQFNNFTSWLTIITIFTTLNLESTLISAKYDYKEKFDEYIFSMLLLSTISTFFWFIIININYNFIFNFTGVNKVYVNAMLLYLVFLPAINMFQARERYLFEYKISVIISLILTLSTAIFSVLLVIMLDNKLTGRIFGMIIPTIIIGGLIYLYFFIKSRKVSYKYWIYAIPICLPYIPHLLGGNLLNSMDKIMIEKWCGSDATAMYSLAYSCGAMVTILVNSINSAYAPWLGEMLYKNDYSKIKRFSNVYILSFISFAVGIMLIAPEILYVLGGFEYMDAKFVITPVAMGCVFQFIYTMFGNVEQFNKKTIGMAFATLTATVVNFVLNYYWIPIIGYVAAAYTTLIGYLVLVLIHMFLVWKMGYAMIYDYKFILLIMVFSLLLSFMITFSYKYIYLRVGLIIIYLFVFTLCIYKNRKKIYKLRKRKKNEFD